MTPPKATSLPVKLAYALPYGRQLGASAVRIVSRLAQIKADIPGQSKDKINLNVDGNTLRISVVRCGCLSRLAANRPRQPNPPLASGARSHALLIGPTLIALRRHVSCGILASKYARANPFIAAAMAFV